MSNFLTESERDTLKAEHRLERNRRVADRIKAVLLSDKGWSYRQIAQAFLSIQAVKPLPLGVGCKAHLR